MWPLLTVPGFAWGQSILMIVVYGIILVETCDDYFDFPVAH